MLAQVWLLVLLPLLSFAAAAPTQKRSIYLIRNVHGQYLSPHHTAAGISDAVFVDGNDRAAHGYLEGSKQLFDVGSDLTWGMTLSETASIWSTVQMRAEDSTPGFSIEGDKLVWKGRGETGGWLVCDWWHGVPQLFWIRKPEEAGTLPASCSHTDLHVEHIEE